MDAELLSEVYAELVGGRQAKLGLGEQVAIARRGPAKAAPRRARRRVVHLTATELAAHRVFAENLGPAAIWRDYPPDEDGGPAGEK
jgi:DNA polymerase-3 subunit epsilon